MQADPTGCEFLFCSVKNCSCMWFMVLVELCPPAWGWSSGAKTFCDFDLQFKCVFIVAIRKRELFIYRDLYVISPCMWKNTRNWWNIRGIRYQMLYIAGANYLQFHGTVITIIITNKTLNSSTIYHNKSIILSDTNQTKEEEHKKKTKTIPQVQCFWWITKMSLHPMFWVFVCVSVSFCVKCCNVLMKTPIFTNK